MRLLRNVRFDDLVSDVATAATKVASGPDMTPPKALPQMRKLREEAIGAFPFIRWIKRLMVTCGAIAMTWTWSAEMSLENVYPGLLAFLADDGADPFGPYRATPYAILGVRRYGGGWKMSYGSHGDNHSYTVYKKSAKAA